ncbi:MAG: DUF554 domain-containing protein [Clostridia bacterium]|nr:DUF554 domain-containing protein [Clostridia bacterium]
MPIGIIVNVICVVAGGWLGSLIGDRLSDALKTQMTTIFGVCALTMGIVSVVLMINMPAVIFSIIIGSLIGILINIDGGIRAGTQALLGKLHLGDIIDLPLMVTAMVLFCASGTGIYGSLTSGMTGDHSILLAKSILDFFTAMIFACQLRKAVMLIGIPQFCIMMILFLLAKVILPLTNDAMIGDFKACGGIILLATGLTICRIKQIPVANMLLSMVLVMPVSAFWQNVIMPLL